MDKDNLAESLSAVIKSIDKLKSGAFDLDEQINKELNCIAFMLDDPDDLNRNMAYDYHIPEGKDLDPVETMKKKYKDISKKKITQAAKEIFSKKNLTLTIKGVKKNVDTEEIAKITEALN